MMKNKYFRLAKKVAKSKKKGIKRQYCLGAVGIRNDGVTVTSYNLPSKQLNTLVHAESRLVRKLDKGSVVYVVRIYRDGTLAMARPCKGCQRAMRLRGVKRCYYSIKGDLGKNNLSKGKDSFEYGVIIFYNQR